MIPVFWNGCETLLDKWFLIFYSSAIVFILKHQWTKKKCQNGLKSGVIHERSDQLAVGWKSRLANREGYEIKEAYKLIRP